MMTIKTNRFTSILFIFSLLLGAPLFATTFYVDASNGNDSNNGTSTSTAWKSVAKAQQAPLKGGDALLFKRAQTFNGRFSLSYSGSAGNPITIGAYGDGARPIISSLGSYNHTFTSQGGNVWKANTPPSVSIERLGSATGELLKATSLSDLNAKYNWYYDGQLYIYSTQNLSNTVLRYSKESTAFSASNRSYVDIKDIQIDGGNRTSMSLSSTSNVNLINVQAGKFTRVALSVQNTTSNMLIDKCVFDSQFTLDYFDAGTDSSTQRGTDDGVEVGGTTSNIEIRNSLFKDWGHSSINIYGTPGNGDVKDIKLHHNEMTAPHIAYGGRLAVDGDAHHVEIYNNYVHDVSNPSQINGHDNHFHHNIIDGVIRSPLHLSRQAGKGIAIQSYVGPVFNNLYENNLFMNTEDEGIYGSANYGMGDIYNNTIRNNIFYDCGKLNNGMMIRFNNSTHIRNNTITNNVFYSPLSTKTFSYHDSKNLLTLSEWETAARNGDVIKNNTNQKPEFVSLANKNYHLAANSTFLSYGIKPKALYDYASQAISAPYALGVYQASAGLALEPISVAPPAEPAPTEPTTTEPEPTFKNGPWKATPPQAGKKKGVLE
jgi:hypothetical protein